MTVGPGIRIDHCLDLALQLIDSRVGVSPRVAQQFGVEGAHDGAHLIQFQEPRASWDQEPDSDQVRAAPAHGSCKGAGSSREPEEQQVALKKAEKDPDLRVLVRPSGTEPKIKFYFFARATGATADTLSSVRDTTDAKLSQAEADLQSWIDSVLS